MKDPFLEQQWQLLCERTKRCASHVAGESKDRRHRFGEQAEAFTRQGAPERYPMFLDRVREAARLAVQWQKAREQSEDAIEVRQRPDLSSGPNGSRRSANNRSGRARALRSVTARD